MDLHDNFNNVIVVSNDDTSDGSDTSDQTYQSLFLLTDNRSILVSSSPCRDSEGLKSDTDSTVEFPKLQRTFCGKKSDIQDRHERDSQCLPYKPAHQEKDVPMTVLPKM